ncbi:MAG: MMPL family transporter [Alphaproteobacteria bacterium]
MSERSYRQMGPAVAALLVWWVDGARRLAWPIVIAGVLLAIAGGLYTVSHLRMNTDIDALLSSELPYRKIFKAYEQDFPELQGNLVVVVEGDSPERAEDAAKALVAKFREHGDLFDDVFYPMGDPFFRREGLLYLKSKDLQELSDRLTLAKPLLATFGNDRSLRGFFDVLGDVTEGVKIGRVEPGMLVRPLNAVADTVEGQLQGKAARLGWHDLVSQTAESASDKRQVIQLKPKVDHTSFTPADAAIKAVRAAAAALDLDPAHGVRVRITGSPALDEDDLKTVKDGVGLASAVSFVLVSIIVFLGLRSPRLVFATIATLVLSLIWTASFAALAIGYLNMISVAFAVLFIGLAVDFSIQFGLRYKESIDHGGSLEAALREAAAGTGVAVSLAAVCAAIGFFAFVPTNYIGLAQLGIIAGFGMFIGLFSTLTVLPAMLALLPLKAGKRGARERGRHAVARLLERHARAVCWGALAVGVAALATFPAARFDIDPINLKSLSSESVQVYLDITKDSRISPYSISIVAPSLAEADALAKRIEKLPEVASTVTLSSFLPPDETAKLPVIERMAAAIGPILQGTGKRRPPSGERRRDATEDAAATLAAFAALPKAGEAAAPAKRLQDVLLRFKDGPGQDLDAYSRLEEALVTSVSGQLDSFVELLHPAAVTADALPANARARYVTASGRARIQVFPAETLDNERALSRFVAAVRAVAPNATGSPVELLEGGRMVVGAFVEAGVIALVAISLLLILVLRSFVDSLLVLLPLALAAALTVALVVVTGHTFNFANIIALPLLFSLGVAFGIYFVLRHRETPGLVDLMRTSTPRAILFSALTTMVSFSTLMLSSHRGTSSMGFLLGSCLTLALVCTLIVLPALLTWHEQRRTPR